MGKLLYFHILTWKVRLGDKMSAISDKSSASCCSFLTQMDRCVNTQKMSTFFDGHQFLNCIQRTLFWWSASIAVLSFRLVTETGRRCEWHHCLQRWMTICGVFCSETSLVLAPVVQSHLKSTALSVWPQRLWLQNTPWWHKQRAQLRTWQQLRFSVLITAVHSLVCAH